MRILLVCVLLACITFPAMPKPASFSFLRQAVNLPALRQLANVMRRPQLLVPHLSLDALSDLDLAQLRGRGVRVIVFDKDNTLTLTYVDELHASSRETIAGAISIFGAHGLAILSNSVGSCDDAGFAGATATEAALGLPVIRHELKKPSCLPEVLAHFEQTGRTAGLLPGQICMVGDRVLTDVLFANLAGMVSVLVRPLCTRTDHPVSVLIRAMERRLLLPLLRLLGYGPGK